MSGTTTPPTTRDRIIADARDLPSLIQTAKAADPDLAASLTPKALVASKSVWGSATSLIVGWAVTKYGLGWDADTCALVTGLLVMGVTAVLRTVTRSPIGGVFTGGTDAAGKAGTA